MANVTKSISDRLDAVLAQINSLREQMAQAEKEKSDLETALRVLSDVTGESVARPAAEKPAKSRPASEKKKMMFDALGVGRDEGLQPAEVHKALTDQGAEDISIQVVRTTLWRAAQKGELSSDDGRYWKHEAESSLYEEPSATSSNAGMTNGGPQLIGRYRVLPASPDAPLSRSGEVEHEVE